VTLLATADGIVHIEAVGKADLAADRPMSPDQLFWIASMTKPVTGAAVMRMREEGKLRVDDRLRSTSPSLPA
jgi:CubicO group peptidase (beta-lactamase class C family)